MQTLSMTRHCSQIEGTWISADYTNVVVYADEGFVLRIHEVVDIVQGVFSHIRLLLFWHKLEEGRDRIQTYMKVVQSIEAVSRDIHCRRGWRC